MTGIVNFVNKEKGFAFILSTDRKSYFAHFSNVANCDSDMPELFTAEPVEFNTRTSGKTGKIESCNIKPLWRCG